MEKNLKKVYVLQEVSLLHAAKSIDEGTSILRVQ